jgi:hypothetical protein
MLYPHDLVGLANVAVRAALRVTVHEQVEALPHASVAVYVMEVVVPFAKCDGNEVCVIVTAPSGQLSSAVMFHVGSGAHDDSTILPGHPLRTGAVWSFTVMVCVWLE